MGNSLGGRRRTAKVMKVDGTTFRYKAPAVAADALRGHPGHHLLESEEVKRFGLRARPLDADASLKPGRLYFLVELPRFPDQGRTPRKTWSGALHVGAKERLESLMLSRRSVSDVAAVTPTSVVADSSGAVRLRMRLPKAEVTRLMQESRDASEAAEKIMQLCVDRDHSSAPATPAAVLPEKKAGKKEKRTRFVTFPDEIIG